MKQILVLALVLLAFVAGCGGSTSAVNPENLPPTNPAGDQPNSSGVMQGQALHNSSGIPTGIRLKWLSVDDTADGGSKIAGYHIYRSDSSIADSDLGDDSFWVTVGGETMVEQAAIPGSLIVADDLFAVIIGETWYYRLSSVASDGDESALSLETAVTIVSFRDTDILLQTTSGGVDDPVVINGENFGEYDAATDRVEIPGMVWVDGVGFEPGMLEAPITDWKPNEITVKVPIGTTFGKFRITIGTDVSESTEEFQNSDPYLTDVDRLDASSQDLITLTGKNFGNSRDTKHRVVYGDNEILSDKDYTVYSDTTITFKPPNLQDYTGHSLTVKVDNTESNAARNNLENAPPTAVLVATPDEGVAPLSIRLDASGSFDPENVNGVNKGILHYLWDFDGDGQYNEFGNGESTENNNPRPRITLNSAQIHTLGVRVYDVEMITGDVVITVDATIPQPPTIFDDAVQPDPDDPGQVDNTNAPDYVVDLFYGIQDGLFPVTIEVDADYAETVAGDPVASFGKNDPAQVYETNNSPFDAADPNISDSVGVHQRIGGDHSLAIRVTDDMNRQAVYVYANPVSYIRSTKVAVIQDDRGDPTGAGPNVSDEVLISLNTLGFQTQLFNSFNLTLIQLAGFDACIWASNGPVGPAPYDWLDAGNLTLMKEFVDSGRSVIVFSPPAATGGADIFLDGDFTTDYQPFKGTRIINGSTGVDLLPLDFTATGPPDIISIQYNGMFGDTNQTTLYPECTKELECDVTGLLEPLGAIRPQVGGGNLYFGMFTYTDITGLDPAGLGVEFLLDYIVSGTIALQ